MFVAGSSTSILLRKNWVPVTQKVVRGMMISRRAQIDDLIKWAVISLTYRGVCINPDSVLCKEISLPINKKPPNSIFAEKKLKTLKRRKWRITV